MEEERGCAGARERRGDLAADDARLAHAGDDHAPAAVEEDAHRLLEAIVEPIDKCQDRGRLGLQDLARERDVDACDPRHARAPDAASAVSRAAASIRFSFMMSGSSRSRRSALAASLFAFDGSACTSMKTASTPAATPAEASGSMYCARPAVTPSPAPGSCRLWVTSKTTG